MSEPRAGSAQAEREDHQLVREIGVPGLTANIVNATVGAGIFALPAAVAAHMGAAAPISYLICAVAMCLFVTCFAMAGSRVSLTGGLYAYVEVAFGSFLGFIAGVLYFLTAILAVSGIVNLIFTSIAGLVPALSGTAGRAGVIFGILASLTFINIRGVKVGARAVEAITLIKLTPLLLFVVIGIFFIRPDALAWSDWPSAEKTGRSVLQLLFAFVGVEVALVPSGEIKRPSRTVPRAIFSALAVTTILYLGIQFVALGLLGDDLARAGDVGLGEAAARIVGDIGKTIMLIALAVSAFGWTASDILSSPRIIYAFGRDGFIPRWFAFVHPQFRTPAVAIVTYSVAAFILSYSSTFQELAVLSNIAVLSLYILCFLGALRLQQRDVRGDGPPFTFPGAWVIPILAILACLWILNQSTAQEFKLILITLIAATVLYLLRVAFQRMRKKT
ncbi:MAG TPA: APC family permease [Chthoniobacterales bacterium]|nr:APC family permease [Chthoniobacterales bacterium]